MIRNLTYHNKETKKEIDEAIGESFGFIESFKMKGSGSPKFIITNASPMIWEMLERTNTTKYCNIELRIAGIIVGFRSGYEVLAWVIPYHKLTVFHNGNTISIYDGKYKIKMIYAYKSDSNSKFFQKLFTLKGKYIQNQSFC